MSYILDALKKATMEREHLHGGVPDLNAQPARTKLSDQSNAEAVHGHGRLKVSTLVITACVMIALGAVAWRVTSPSFKALGMPPITSGLSVDPATVPLAAQPLSAAPTPTVPKMPPPLASTALPSTSTRSSVSPLIAKSNRPRSPTAPSLETPLPLQTPSVSLPALPDNAPKLVVSGSTYSENPDYRILILNGQVFREAESPAAGIIIKKIGARAAVVQFGGKDFLLRY